MLGQPLNGAGQQGFLSPLMAGVSLASRRRADLSNTCGGEQC